MAVLTTTEIAPPEPRRAPPRSQPRRRHPGRDPAPARRRRLRRADHGRRGVGGRRRQGDDLPPLAHQAGPRRRHHLRPQPRRGHAARHRLARGRPARDAAVAGRGDHRPDRAPRRCRCCRPCRTSRRWPRRSATARCAVWRQAFDAGLGAGRGARRGAPPGSSGSVVAEATSALLVQRWLLTGEPVDEAYADEVLDTVVLPLRPRSRA